MSQQPQLREVDIEELSVAFEGLLSTENEEVEKVEEITEERTLIYICVALDMNVVKELEIHPEYLEGKKVNEEFHVTLAYDPSDEEIKNLKAFEKEIVQVKVVGCGYSVNAISAHVESFMSSEEREELPYYPSHMDKPRHITIALLQGVRAVDSFNVIINALKGMTHN